MVTCTRKPRVFFSDIQRKNELILQNLVFCSPCAIYFDSPPSRTTYFNYQASSKDGFQGEEVESSVNGI